MNELATSLTRRLLVSAMVFGALLALALLAWQAAHVLLIVFSAILFAILATSLAAPLRQRLGIGQRPAVVLVLVLIALLLVAFAWAVGPQIGVQLTELSERLPDAVERLRTWLAESPWNLPLSFNPSADWLPELGRVLGRLSGIFSTAFGSLVTVLLVVILGFYLTLDPPLYQRGVLQLVPGSAQARAAELLDLLTTALRWWLLGQLLTMLVIGLLTGIGLWLIGIPLVLTLSLIAALLAFIPYLGPVLSVIPAVLIAFVDEPLKAVPVLALYGGIQFLEGNFITPFIQHRAVALAPALLLTAQLLMAVLFGFAGVLLATPLAVAVIVLVQTLYVRDWLGNEVRILGQHD